MFYELNSIIPPKKTVLINVFFKKLSLQKATETKSVGLSQFKAVIKLKEDNIVSERRYTEIFSSTSNSFEIPKIRASNASSIYTEIIYYIIYYKYNSLGIE